MAGMETYLAQVEFDTRAAELVGAVIVPAVLGVALVHAAPLKA
jgi:hypothetical protein